MADEPMGTTSRGVALTRPIEYGSVVLALAAALFSRIAVAGGLPRALNFVHFPLVAVAAMIVAFRSRCRRVAVLLVGIACLCAAMGISALMNRAGVVNVLLDLVLLGEPFLLLVLMVHTPWPADRIASLRRWLLRFLWLHVLAAWYQWLVLGLRSDDVKGLFVNQIAGHHVGGAVGLTGAIYFALEWPGRSAWMRAVFVVLAAGVTVLADAKQVIAAALAALLALALYGFRRMGPALRYLLLAFAAAGVLVIAAMTIFPALGTWADPDLVENGLAQKLSVFSVIAQHRQDPWRYLFGLGPGHTIGRLGWMVPDYFEYLGPLGATVSPLTQLIRDANDANWLSADTGSSMWSLLFSWAGIWGDLGLIGGSLYILLWAWVWRNACQSDLSRFFLLNLLGLGCVYAWLEEPACVLLVVALIGLRYRGNANTLRT